MTLPRYAIRAPGAAGATVKQRAEALSEDGPLEVGPAHLVPLLLPDAFGKTAGGADWVVPQHTLSYLLVPSAQFSTTLKRGGVHWALSAGRSAKFLYDLSR